MTDRRTLLALVVTAGFVALLGQSASAGPPVRVNQSLRAFERAKLPSDALDVKVGRAASVSDSRRIANYVDRGGRHWTLYLAKTGTSLCQVLVRSSFARGVEGSGGGCSPGDHFLGTGRFVEVSTGRLFSGVARNEVAHLAIVGSKGARHLVDVTADGGFIYDCQAYNGCINLIACVETYARGGQLLSIEAVLPGGCARRK